VSTNTFKAEEQQAIGSPTWVLDALQMGVIVLDKLGRIVLFNRWMAKHTSLSSQQVIGQPFADIFPELVTARVGVAVEACLKMGLPAMLSNSLHPTPFPLFADSQRRMAQERVQQSIRIQAAPGTTVHNRQVLIEIADVTAAVRRERMLQQQTLQLKFISTKDSLTGLANRRQLDEVLLRECKRATRSQEPMAVVLIDIDLFKLYNDTYGHQAGDACIVAVAGCLQSVLKRPGDVAARYGGEEFVLVLPNTDLTGATKVASALRVAAESMQIAHAGSAHGGVVTISQGVAARVPDPMDSGQMLIAQADVALYAAKRAGRNRVATLPGNALLDPDVVLAPMPKAEG
jgi:diguanylate cyclase (GGDEF)-like protein